MRNSLISGYWNNLVHNLWMVILITTVNFFVLKHVIDTKDIEPLDWIELLYFALNTLSISQKWARTLRAISGMYLGSLLWKDPLLFKSAVTASQMDLATPCFLTWTPFKIMLNVRSSIVGTLPRKMRPHRNLWILYLEDYMWECSWLMIKLWIQKNLRK